MIDKTQTLVLERKHLTSQMQIDGHMLVAASNVELVHWKILDKFADEFTAIIYFAGTKHIRTESTEVPADWWQHFKQRWLRRLPVRMKKITTINEYWNVCPHFVMDESEKHVVWLNRTPWMP